MSAMLRKRSDAAAAVWAVGGNGAILKTIDGGASWTAQSSGVNSVLIDIYALDAGTAWVVGGGGAILKTTDGGLTWTPQASGTSEYITGISAVDDDTAWATSYYGVILKTTDGGLTWTPQASGTTKSLNNVSAIDPATAWAAGGGGTILKTVDGGDAGPDILSLSPLMGSVGTQVTIAGCDFGAGPPDVANFVSFGGVKPQAGDYISWADKQIVVKVPAGVSGIVAVTVTTPAGVSNPKDFMVTAPLTLTSITPTNAGQYSFFVDIAVEGTGFLPGATLKLQKGNTSLLEAYNLNVTDSKITGTVTLFGAEPGAYDVVVTNPDSQQASLTEEFTVTSACGAGSGGAILLLGITLGLLSLAGSARLRRKKR